MATIYKDDGTQDKGEASANILSNGVCELGGITFVPKGCAVKYEGCTGSRSAVLRITTNIGNDILSLLGLVLPQVLFYVKHFNLNFFILLGICTSIKRTSPNYATNVTTKLPSI